MKSTNFYDYPRDQIERRKLVRQLRNLQLHAAPGTPILKEFDPQTDVLTAIASLENDIARHEETRCVSGI